jgi:hypothetical protein
MRVACEPLPMRPITKLTPEHSFNLAALVGRSQREESETGTSGTSRKVTSLRHVIHLIASISAVLLLSRHTTICIFYYYSTNYRMHLHIITTSPRKGPTRPAAPRPCTKYLLTVHPT